MAFYPAIPASDGTSMEAKENSQFQVFELYDSTRSNPLPLLTTAGTNAAPLVTTAQGVVPPVNVVSPNVRHIFKSGEWEWERQSFDGAEEAVKEARNAAGVSAMAAQEAVSLAKAPTDESVDRGIERAGIPRLVAQAIAADGTVTEAAEAAVSNAAAGMDLIEGSDVRLPVLAQGDFRHAWADPTGAMNLYDKPTGEVVAPLGIETPNAGLPTPEDMPYLWVSAFDAVNQAYPELLLGMDGCVPQWVLDRWKARMGLPGEAGSSLAMRRTGVALTLSAGTNVTDTRTAVHLRLPFRIAAPPKRFRIHIRNHNDRSNLPYSGALSVTGIWGGAHAGNGLFSSTPVKLANAFSTSTTGGEYVTDWVESDTLRLDAYGEYLFSLGYTCAAQTNHAGQGGSWQSGAPSEASVASPATPLSRSQTSPLDIWVEVEVSAKVPIGAFIGDSLTCGTGATLPVYESYAAKHALAHGYIPQIMANHGSTMADWGSASQWKWLKYAGLDRPDSVLWALGGNDVFGGVDLPTLQSRFVTLAATVRSRLSTTIYLANIMPRDRAVTDPLEVSRNEYNDWLATLPERAINMFDFATTVAQPDNPSFMDTRYNSGDDVHLNTTGYARNAAAITAPLSVAQQSR